MEIKKDFGTVYLETNINKDEFKVFNRLSQFMKDNGYDLNHNDICNIDNTWSDEQVDVLFKFVHYSVPSIVTEPYYKITFKKK